MAKKKQPRVTPGEFNHNPFRDLKGLNVSGQEAKADKTPVPDTRVECATGSFAEEMEKVGVERMNQDVEEETTDFSPQAETGEKRIDNQSDADLFLEAMSELQVRFEDHLSGEEPPALTRLPRMKRLKQGRVTPDASLDLHGFTRVEVAEKLRYFLQNARYRGWQTLLVITGKGLHSETGEPVLRDAVEQFLSGEGRQFVVEWGRAPAQYGGGGALVLFLRDRSGNMNK